MQDRSAFPKDRRKGSTFLHSTGFTSLHRQVESNEQGKETEWFKIKGCVFGNNAINSTLPKKRSSLYRGNENSSAFVFTNVGYYEAVYRVCMLR